MGSHSVTFHPTQANTPRLHPSQIGWYSIYRPFKGGRLSKPRPRVQRATGPLLWYGVPYPAFISGAVGIFSGIDGSGLIEKLARTLYDTVSVQKKATVTLNITLLSDISRPDPIWQYNQQTQHNLTRPTYTWERHNQTQTEGSSAAQH